MDGVNWHYRGIKFFSDKRLMAEETNDADGVCDGRKFGNFLIALKPYTKGFARQTSISIEEKCR